MRKLTNKLLVLAMVLILALSVVGCGGTEETKEDASKEEKFKVAFIYVGPVGDAGWSWAHDQGRQQIEKEIENVETTYVESVPEGADAERVLTELAEKGNKVIFATSFGYMDYIEKVAKKYRGH